MLYHPFPGMIFLLLLPSSFLPGLFLHSLHIIHVSPLLINFYLCILTVLFAAYLNSPVFSFFFFRPCYLPTYSIDWSITISYLGAPISLSLSALSLSHNDLPLCDVFSLFVVLSASFSLDPPPQLGTLTNLDVRTHKLIHPINCPLPAVTGGQAAS